MLWYCYNNTTLDYLPTESRYVANDRTFSVRLPIQLIEDIDNEVEKSGFTNRTDFIKSACRYYILKMHEIREEKKTSDQLGEKTVVSQTTSGRT